MWEHTEEAHNLQYNTSMDDSLLLQLPGDLQRHIAKFLLQQETAPLATTCHALSLELKSPRRVRQSRALDQPPLLVNAERHFLFDKLMGLLSASLDRLLGIDGNLLEGVDFEYDPNLDESIR